MTLAKALKRKNRIAQKINTLQQEIQRENSARANNPRKIDVNKLMVDLQKAKNDLIKLKIGIFVASTPMRENILKMGELKAHVVFLRGISTKEGTVSDYGETEVEYTAVFDKLYIKTETERAEEEIDSIQDELDIFNHKTEVEV